MKIAICLVGQLRTGNITSKSIRHYIGNMWNFCDFFIHTWNINTPALNIEFKSNSMWDLPVTFVKSEELSQYCGFYDPVIFMKDDFEEFKSRKYPHIKNSKSLLGMPFYNSVKLALTLKKNYEFSYDFLYDYVVVLRHDSVITTDRSLREDVNYVKTSNFLFYDMYDTENKIDSTLWISDSRTSENIIKFINRRIELDICADDQEELYTWVSSYCGKQIISIKDSYWLYRNYHKKLNIDLENYEILKKISQEELIKLHE